MTIDPTALRSIAQAAKAMPFSEPAIHNTIDRGEIRTVRIAGHIYLDEAEIRRAFGDLYNPRSAS